MAKTDKITSEFEKHRPAIAGLAYRMTGSHAEAEDLAQEVYLHWLKADHASISNPRSWLMTVCSRRSIDTLRSGRVSRTDYIGPWLPEPLQTKLEDEPAPSPESKLEIAENVTMAFLMVLERLAPKERAAYLLHDIFDVDYSDIAVTLEISEPACRKLASRARQNVQNNNKTVFPAKDKQEMLVDVFLEAIHTGNTSALASQLAEDVVLKTDGGGKAKAVIRPLCGQRPVTRFIGNVLGRAWRGAEIITTEINATLGILVKENGKTVATVSFVHDEDGKVADVLIMRNPDKLALLD